MPLYEYQCESCAKRFERIQKYSDPPIDTCPSCGARVKKLMSSPAIQFKGSGFYITDYPKKSQSDGKTQTDGSGAKPESPGASGDSGASAPSTTSTSTSDTSSTTKDSSSKTKDSSSTTKKE